ncbi:MAG: hypothetical protein R2794_13460 [Chitinophagales bacterium]
MHIPAKFWGFGNLFGGILLSLYLLFVGGFTSFAFPGDWLDMLYLFVVMGMLFSFPGIFLMILPNMIISFVLPRQKVIAYMLSTLVPAHLFSTCKNICGKGWA